MDRLKEIKAQYEEVIDDGILKGGAKWIAVEDIGWFISEIEQLRKDLMEYGKHLEGCDERHYTNIIYCNCGFKQALKEGQ